MVKKSLATPTAKPARSGSSTTRVLSILDLFTLENPVWSADELIEQLGQGRATIYRYLRALTDAGFLVPTAGAGYILGPRFVEFDRQIRLADPLLQFGKPILAETREKVAGMQLICSFYGDRVLTVYEDKFDPSIKAKMERGRPFDLLLGAPSKIILAHLPVYHLKSLYLNHSRRIEAAGIGENWDEFRAKLKAIREDGYYAGSEIDPELIGLAAPIFQASCTIIGSVCMVRKRKDAKPDVIDTLKEIATDAGKRISAALQSRKPKDAALQNVFPTARMVR